MLNVIKTPCASGRPTATAQPQNFLIPDIGKPWPFAILYGPGGRWGVSEAIIDPEMAEILMQYNRPNNRKQKPHSIARFSRDMAEGRWRFTHEGIAFNSIAELIDGQHRLTSSIETKTQFRSLVFFGFDEMECVNTGGVRDAAAAATIIGLETNKGEMATLRNFLMGSSSVFAAYTNPEMIYHHRVHHKMLTWSRQVFSSFTGTSRIITAPVRGAICRAYYHVELKKLNRFIDVLRLEVPATEPGDRSAIALRNSIEGGSNQAGTLVRRDTFCKTLRAIQAFCAGEDLKLVRPMDLDDIYPIPNEQQVAELER